MRGGAASSETNNLYLRLDSNRNTNLYDGIFALDSCTSPA